MTAAFSIAAPLKPAGADSAGLPLCGHYRVGVIPILLRTNCPDARRRFDWAYGPYAVPPADDRPVVLDVVRTGARWRRDVRFELFSNNVRRSVVARAAELLPYLDWAANWAIGLDRREYLQVHAACVSRDGEGLILAGAPESGKTTLAAALLLTGWQYLCDEFALLHPDTAELQPYPKALSIKQPSFALLRSLRPRLPLSTAVRRERVRVASLPAHRLRADAVGEPCRVRLIVFPKVVGGAASELRRISPAEALFRLNQQSFNGIDYGVGAIDLFERLVRSADCYAMTSGDLRTSITLLEHARAAARRLA